jgi:ubiquinone/menaquinone biosynthesis C-methylase UbiE
LRMPMHRFPIEVCERGALEIHDLVDEQLNYYRARAPEYDQWFLRQGRYDRGPDHRAEWFREVTTVEQALEPAIEGKSILELACGTGLWTQRLAARASWVHAVDAAPEMLSLNRGRLQAKNVHYVNANIFAWRPPMAFDLVFFSFWLSHVPQNRFEEFWRTVRRALRPDGSVFFVDNLLTPKSTARDDDPIDGSGTVRRKLNDGRAFQIVKIFYEPQDLERRLSVLGWKAQIRSTGDFFLYGSVKPSEWSEDRPRDSAPKT